MQLAPAPRRLVEVVRVRKFAAPTLVTGGDRLVTALEDSLGSVSTIARDFALHWHWSTSRCEASNKEDD